MIKSEEFSMNYTLSRGTLLGTKPNDLHRVFLIIIKITFFVKNRFCIRENSIVVGARIFIL